MEVALTPGELAGVAHDANPRVLRYFLPLAHVDAGQMPVAYHKVLYLSGNVVQTIRVLYNHDVAERAVVARVVHHTAAAGPNRVFSPVVCAVVLVWLAPCALHVPAVCLVFIAPTHLHPVDRLDQLLAFRLGRRFFPRFLPARQFCYSDKWHPCRPLLP